MYDLRRRRATRATDEMERIVQLPSNGRFNNPLPNAFGDSTLDYIGARPSCQRSRDSDVSTGKGLRAGDAGAARIERSALTRVGLWRNCGQRREVRENRPKTLVFFGSADGGLLEQALAALAIADADLAQMRDAG